MSIRTVSLAIALVFTLMTAPRVSADLLSATTHYHEKNYPAALQEFQQLAKLGNKKAQFNLGVMILKGQATKPDPIEAYAWIKLANETPSEKAAQALKVIENALPAEALAQANLRARQLSSQYGQQALSPLPPSTHKVPANAVTDAPSATAIHRVPPRYPGKMVKRLQQGWVTLEFDVLPDGSVSNVHVVESFPPGGFDKEAIAAVEKWKFKVKYPENTRPEPIPITQTIEFAMEGDRLQQQYRKLFRKNIQKIHQVAASGNPEAQYIYAAIAGSKRDLVPEALRLTPQEANQWLLKAAQNGYPAAQFMLGRNIFYGRGAKAEPQKGLFWLEQAATRGESRASRMLYDILSKGGISNTTGHTAEEWLTLSAKDGNPDSMLTWANLVSQKENPSPEELHQAREYLEAVRKQREPGLTWRETSARLYRLAGDEYKASREEKKVAKLRRQAAKNIHRTDYENFKPGKRD